MSTSRRDFLKFAALLSGATGVSGFVPESIQRAFAIEPAPGSTFEDAEHVVLLMQENRSFDHALGTLQGVRGFNDPRAIRKPDGNSVFAQTSANTGKTYAPWRLDMRDTRITWMGSLPHSRESQVDAWNQGGHDNWLDAKKSGKKDYQQIPITMGYYTREDLPFYYALADAFTVCDQNYCSVMTSTMPNRSVFWTGTVRDRKSADSMVYVRNDSIMRYEMAWKTFPERLSDAGVSWRVYQNELTTTSGLSGEERLWLSNYEDNVLEYFAAYNIGAAALAPDMLQKELEKAQKTLAELEAEAAKDGQANHLKQRLTAARGHLSSLKKQVASAAKGLNAKQQALHDAAFVTNRSDPHYRSLEPLTFTVDGREQTVAVPKGDALYQFRENVAAGKLPTVSWLVPSERLSDHPSSPWYGAWYVSEVLEILTKNPEVWKKTIFILTYDENDGYFDHAPSFVAPDPKRPETGTTSAGLESELEFMYASDDVAQGVSEHGARTAPIGMGFRVPMIVASPWTRGGWVNSQVFDHTSTLQFLERFLAAKGRKDVREENISGWRRAVAGDLTSCFRTTAKEDLTFEYVDGKRHVERIASAREKPLPTGYKELTTAEVATITANPREAGVLHQEPGTRPSCALPYELYADGSIAEDGQSFVLALTAGDAAFGTRSAGAPFNVYLWNLAGERQMRPATYTVKAGDTLQPAFPLAAFRDGRFEVEVLGPNGFYRRFVGSAKDLPVRATLAYETHPHVPTGVVQLHLQNAGSAAQTVTITDNSYGAAAITKKLAPGSREVVRVQTASSHHWYDLTVRSEHSSARMHFAGRVETGSATRTDPLMGRA